MKRVDEKLARIRAGKYTRADFIIADAKDPDMGPSLTWAGPVRAKDGAVLRLRTREEFLDQMQSIVEQDIVDVMLTSVSNLERLHRRGVFTNSATGSSTPKIKISSATYIVASNFKSGSSTPSPKCPTV